MGTNFWGWAAGIAIFSILKHRTAKGKKRTGVALSDATLRSWYLPRSPTSCRFSNNATRPCPIAWTGSRRTTWP